MSTLVDAADVNPVVMFLPRDLSELRQMIVEAVAAIDRQMMQRVWLELDYRIDICRVTNGGNVSTRKVGQKFGVSLPLFTCSPST
jgi:hypothetical protein